MIIHSINPVLITLVMALGAFILGAVPKLNKKITWAAVGWALLVIAFILILFVIAPVG